MKDTCGLLAKLHLALSILFLVTAQWEFPLQQPMKCYCIIIHLLRPIRIYQQKKKFNLNPPLCATEWQGHEIKARGSVLQWFATPRHNRVRERGIPVFPGFPDSGWGWGRGACITSWFQGGGWCSVGGLVNYVLELLVAATSAFALLALGTLHTK